MNPTRFLSGGWLKLAAALWMGAGTGWLACGDPLASSGSKVKIEPAFPLRVRAFALQDVRLLDGPFRRAMELDRRYLLSLEPDRLLHAFRLNAGLPSAAQPLGGWEEPKCEVRGHFVGHYLTACALMHASAGDAELRRKVEAVVAGLAQVQARLGSGFLSAYPEEFIDRVEAQKQVWAPYYTLHKIYAGLLDAYVYCDNPQALDIARKFGDWAIGRNGRLSEAQMQKMLGNEHGGMNEALANLYGLTGERKYLDIALRFNHQDLVGPFSRRQDNLTGKHANTQIPKFVGAARLTELTGDAALRTASLHFWDVVARERSYVIGGHSDGEMFTPKERLSTAFGPSTTETCNTYNMLKLTRHLFCWDPKAEYADFYERALYNHILCSQNPDTGMMCYYVPLRSGSRKNYNGPLDCFWCCTGTGIENHAKYGDSIYFHDGLQALYVNLFIASELDWKAKGIKLRQETAYPDQEGARLIVSCERPAPFALHLRIPWWAVNGAKVKLNGRDLAVAARPGAFTVIDRVWQNGDVLDLSMPFSLRAEGFRDNPRRLAFLSGPIVLAAQVEPGKPFPAVVSAAADLTTCLKPVPGKGLTYAGAAETFRVPGASGQSLTLEPFFRIHGNRHYMVYFDAFTPDQWKSREAEYLAEMEKRRLIEARTVDAVNPGEEQNERDHQLKGERTGAGDFGGRKWRHATEGGWFSWQLRVQPGQPQELLVTYWGSDGGNRVFDVLIDDRKLATQRLQQDKPEQFFDRSYPVPAELTQGKDRVTLKFQAHPGAFAGGVFGVRLMRPEPK